MSKENYSFEQIKALKKVMGIEAANCETCAYLGTDGDGPEYNGSWPICNKIERMGYLKSFPFKKEMKCWWPSFWYSKFVEMIHGGTEKEIEDSGNAFKSAYESVTNQ